MKYQTKHRQELLLYLEKNQDKHLTISEIQSDLQCVPASTLYRLMEDLEKEGIVRKYLIDPNMSCCYQYNSESCHQHFHLICERCGKLIHLECHEVDHLLSHIQEEHGFKVDLSKINLYGLCPDCLETK